MGKNDRYKECILKIVNRPLNRVSQEEVEDVVSAMDDLASDPRFSEMDRTIKLEEAAKEYKAALALKNKQNYLNYLSNKDKHDRLIERINKNPNAHIGLRELVAGGPRAVEGAEDSTWAKMVGYQASLKSGMAAELKRATLWEQAVGMSKGAPDLERNTFIEMARLTDPDQLDTHDVAAKKMASIFGKYLNIGREMQNAQGADIGLYKGWAIPNRHDPITIAAAGFARWIEDAQKWFDFARMKIAPEDQDRILGEMFTELSTGLHVLDSDRISTFDSFISAQRSPLTRVTSASRVIHFNSAADAYSYMKAYSGAPLFNNIVSTLDVAGRRSAVMEDWGTNPEAMFAQVVRTLQQKVLNNDVLKKKPGYERKLEKLTGYTGWTFKAFKQYLLAQPASFKSNRSARIGANIRAFEVLSKLSGLALSQLTDLPITMASLQHNGVNILDAAMASFMAPLKGITRHRDMREYWHTVDVGLDAAISNMLADIQPDLLATRLNKASNFMLKWTGAEGWTRSMKTSVYEALSANLAFNADNPFWELNKALQIQFKRHGINEEMWNIMRRGLERAPNGRSYLTPQGVGQLPDSAFDEKFTRERVGNALQRFLSIEVMRSMNVPDPITKTMAAVGLEMGTWGGEVARTMMQFKTFAITYTRNTLGRLILNKGNAAGTIGVLGTLLVGQLTMGYVSRQAKRLLKGQDIENPAETATWINAFLQSGGLGIYGEVLNAALARGKNTGGIWSSVLGPAASDAVRLVEGLSMFAQSLPNRHKRDDQEIFKNITQIGLGPLTNFVYTKAALDYLIFNQINEFLNPGYMQRTMRRAHKYGQGYWFKPQSIWKGKALSFDSPFNQR